MLTLHHLAYSRSQRVLWLLEEIGIPFELVRYERDGTGRAPAALARIHPLGKSPVVVDGDLTLAESATILRYIDERYGDGRFTPAPGTDDRHVHEEWLDYVESSAALPVMIALLARRSNDTSPAMQDFCDQGVAQTLGYIAAGLGDKPFLMGERVMLADMQMSYFLGMADMVGALDGYPALTAYYDRLRAQPAFRRAEGKGGPMMPPAGR